jgi:hypothetical protein
MKKFIILAAALAMNACDGLTSPEFLEVRVLTSGEIYIRAASGAFPIIEFTVANTARQTVYISACGGEVASEALIRRGAEYVPASAALCPAHLDASPIALAPGAAVQGRRTVAEVGEYRLRIGVAPGPTAPASWRTLSNTFVVQ